MANRLPCDLGAAGLGPHFEQQNNALLHCCCFVLYSGENVCVYVCESLSCVQLCNPMDCSLPGSSALGILQARILEWIAIPFSS